MRLVYWPPSSIVLATNMWPWWEVISEAMGAVLVEPGVV
jgi:hypothetical protein